MCGRELLAGSRRRDESTRLSPEGLRRGRKAWVEMIFQGHLKISPLFPQPQHLSFMGKPCSLWSVEKESCHGHLTGLKQRYRQDLSGSTHTSISSAGHPPHHCLSQLTCGHQAPWGPPLSLQSPAKETQAPDLPSFMRLDQDGAVG